MTGILVVVNGIVNMRKGGTVQCKFATPAQSRHFSYLT